MSIQAIAGTGAASPMHAMSGASGAGASPRQKMSNLFDAIDGSGSGSIDKAQFNQAFATRNPPAVFRAAGAQAIWSRLDPNGTGSVSRDSFVSVMSQLMASLRAQGPAGASAGGVPTLQSSTAALQSIGTDGTTSPTGSRLNLSV